ncbi:hypothetical protein ACA097_18230 [Pseudomonas sp. QL9]|uniref:hypothetical protein n=1 Tax=Pseudomonas sp. QL9 TaxID=3242725 RepID=UPI00352A2C63
MKRIPYVIATLILGAWVSAALADGQCQGPVKDGNTWNLVCSADESDGSDDSDYQCDYVLSLTNAQGLSRNVEVSGSVSPGQSGAIIWSAIQSENADIVSASIVSGSCSL